MEEETIKAHFEKIIVIGQKLHYRKSQVCEMDYSYCLGSMAILVQVDLFFLSRHNFCFLGGAI